MTLNQYITRLRARAVLPPISVVERSLWGRLGSKSRDADADLPVAAVFGFSRSTTGPICEMLRSLDMNAYACFPGPNTPDRLAAIPEWASHVVVNIDAFGDTGEAVDCLMAFRQQRPTVRVVAVTRACTGDDFGSERQMICDATLRAPVSCNRLAAAFRSDPEWSRIC
mgnify:CR=1 FL=1